MSGSFGMKPEQGRNRPYVQSEGLEELLGRALVAIAEQIRLEAGCEIYQQPFGTVIETIDEPIVLTSAGRIRLCTIGVDVSVMWIKLAHGRWIRRDSRYVTITD